MLGLATILFASCSKNDELECLSGNGGNLTIRVTPEFNGNPIISTNDNPVTVYMAFSVSQFPGKNPENYQKKLVGKNDNPWVQTHGMQCGIYYLFATYTDEQGTDFAGQLPLSTYQTDGTLEATIRMAQE